MNKIVQVNNLEKSYKDVKAVKGIDFYVEEGKLFETGAEIKIFLLGIIRKLINN